MSPVIIRPFVAADAPALNAVALAAFEQYRDLYQPWDKFQSGIAAMANLSQVSRVLVAEQQGAVIGGVAYVGPGTNPAKAAFFDASWAIMRMLVVAPQARGGGVGKQLALACIDLARAEGVEVFALHTSPIMQVALPMYLRLGFAFHQDAPPLYGVPYHVYTKSLKPTT